MVRQGVLRIWLDVEAAVQEQHEQVEFVSSPVVGGDAGVGPAPEAQKELGRAVNDLADDFKVVKGCNPRQAAFSQQPGTLQVAQRDGERPEVIKVGDDGPYLADSG